MVRWYGNSLSSRPMEAPLGHDIAPSKLLQGLALPHTFLYSVCTNTYKYKYIYKHKYKNISPSKLLEALHSLHTFPCSIV